MFLCKKLKEIKNCQTSRCLHLLGLMPIEFMLELLLNKCDDILVRPSGTPYLSGGVLHSESKSITLTAIRRSQDDNIQKVSGHFSVLFQMPGISVAG